MIQSWYVRLGLWLCEKAGHFPDNGWIHGGYYHRHCKLCGRIVSEKLSRRMSDD